MTGLAVRGICRFIGDDTLHRVDNFFTYNSLHTHNHRRRRPDGRSICGTDETVDRQQTQQHKNGGAH